MYERHGPGEILLGQLRDSLQVGLHRGLVVLPILQQVRLRQVPRIPRLAHPALELLPARVDRADPRIVTLEHVVAPEHPEPAEVLPPRRRPVPDRPLVRGGVVPPIPKARKSQHLSQ